MKTGTASNSMQSILVLYNMHSNFFKKALDGIPEEDAHKRLNTNANHIAWLAGSLVHQRYELAKYFGSQLVQSGNELFENNKGIVDGADYPALKQYQQDWDSITPVLQNELATVNDEKLDSEIDMGGMKMTLYDWIVFATYREANCIGQIALWRRLLNHPAIKYD